MGAIEDSHAIGIGPGGRTRKVRPDRVGVDPVVRRRRTRNQHTGAAGEPGEIETANRDVRAGDCQAIGEPGQGTVDLDQGGARIARLGEAVDQDRLGDRRQRGDWGDGLEALAKDREIDGVCTVGSGVGVDNRLAEGAGAGVVRGGHEEGGQERAILEPVETDAAGGAAQQARWRAEVSGASSAGGLRAWRGHCVPHGVGRLAMHGSLRAVHIDRRTSVLFATGWSG